MGWQCYNMNTEADYEVRVCEVAPSLTDGNKLPGLILSVTGYCDVFVMSCGMSVGKTHLVACVSEAKRCNL